MDEKGCTRKFLFLSKHYQWKNLRVKLVASEESHCGEGVLFIKKKSGNSSSASETFSYASLHPYSSFVANFEVFGKMYGEKDALHEINKELFLEKMKEWGVEVEGLPKEAENELCYFLGYRIIQKYTEKNGKDSWKDIYNMPLKEFYEKDAVMMAANKFSDKCYIKIDALENQYVGVWFKLKYEVNTEVVQKMLAEFCNEALEIQIRLDLEKRFGNLREIIYRKAFSPVGGIQE